MRTVTGLHTSGGRMILKRYRGEGMKRRLDALCEALDHVLDAGVEIAPYMRTADGQAYLPDQEGLWTLQPWLTGRHLSMRVPEERLAAAKALAELHRVPTGRLTKRAFLLRVPSLAEKYRYRLERAQEATLKELSLRYLWRPHAERAKQSLHLLQQGSYQSGLERDLQRGTLCHRDPAPHNFIWQGDLAAIIDFDLAGHDVRAHDLYQLMNHALYLNGWEPGLFARMIDSYEQVYPLCVNNRHVLGALMHYPSLVIREWYDYGKSNDRRSLRTRLKWAIRQEEQRLREFSESICFK